MSNVLVIEENRLVRWALKEFFQNEDFNTTAVESHRTAVKIVEKSKFQLIIATYEQSNPMALEAIKKINSLQPDSMLVILTTDIKEQIMTKLSDLPLYDVIEKPFNIDRFLAISQTARTLKKRLKEETI